MNVKEEQWGQDGIEYKDWNNVPEKDIACYDYADYEDYDDDDYSYDDADVDYDDEYSEDE